MFSSCLRLSTSINKLPFLVFLIVFRVAFVEIIFFYKERREFGLAHLQRFNNNESGEVCCFILRVWMWQISFNFFIWRRHIFFTGLCSITTHHGVQLVLGLNQGGNSYALFETGIHAQYVHVGTYYFPCFQERCISLVLHHKYFFFFFVGFARSYVSRVILLGVRTSRFLQAIFLHMVQVIFTAFGTCMTSSAGFPVVSIFWAFEAPQGS